MGREFLRSLEVVARFALLSSVVCVCICICMSKTCMQEFLIFSLFGEKIK